MLASKLCLMLALFGQPQGRLGYYRHPTIHKDTVVFTAEGDLWRASVRGGIAQKLTSHPAQERLASISPDGQTIAFSAQYEGPMEVYTMPLGGGAPVRRTFDGAAAIVVGWTPKSELLYRTRKFSTLPKGQLFKLDLKSGKRTPVPLYQASDGVYDERGRLFFTRLEKQSSHTKRYKGGTAQNLWRFDGTKEAIPLTADYAGTSKDPMWFNGRLYFISDQDGVMNLWSSDENGKGRKQLTKHQRFDAKGAAQHGGRIVYQHGADLRLYDIAKAQDRKLEIRLASDFDHLRERWVKKPLEYLTHASISPDGASVALTARGEVFVAPVKSGRFVEATRRPDVRYREAQFFPDGKSLLAFSDESGEYELVRLSANGVEDPKSVTQKQGAGFRQNVALSPSGERAAYTDRDKRLWFYDLKTKTRKKIGRSVAQGNYFGLRWSPDSEWLAYAVLDSNQMARVHLYAVQSGKSTVVTSARYNSVSPAWSPDGKWLYFLSDRHLKSKVPSPWGPRQPEPFLDRAMQVFLLSLKKGGISPFEPKNELSPKSKKKDKDKDKDKKKSEVKVEIDLGGIMDRLVQAPVPPGNYGGLSLNQTTLFWTDRNGSKTHLEAMKITSEKPKKKVLVKDIRSYELSLKGEHLLVLQKGKILVFKAAEKPPAKLAEHRVNLKGWTFSVDPKREWRQLFVEAWRLERDFFYDPGMHGVDWPKILKKYLPLVDRVTDRSELSDLIGEMVGELAALHIFVVGGDMRDGPDHLEPASLGAVLERTEKGAKIVRIYSGDPDLPKTLSPLVRPGVDVRPGDVIEQINGVPVTTVPDPHALLRGQAGKQVRLRVQSKGKTRDVIVVPVTQRQEQSMRYTDWELTRRLRVEEKSKGQIGYVHLRAMGGGNYSEWARDYFPVFNRRGLIIDVRNNRGGNIDSWILARLLRRAWFYWKPRAGAPYWNMQYAFRGHMVVLVNEHTASDGEAFAEGFRRLGLGKVIGTRTWGGEIWLSFDNWLLDRGIASAAEYGVYGPEGQWLIEGHGVDPDIVVDNLPAATYRGEDAQLEAAIQHLSEAIKRAPRTPTAVPLYPDKSKP